MKLSNVLLTVHAMLCRVYVRVCVCVFCACCARLYVHPSSLHTQYDRRVARCSVLWDVACCIKLWCFVLCPVLEMREFVCMHFCVCACVCACACVRLRVRVRHKLNFYEHVLFHDLF